VTPLAIVVPSPLTMAYLPFTPATAEPSAYDT
jgi:hypothetical protein